MKSHSLSRRSMLRLAAMASASISFPAFALDDLPSSTERAAIDALAMDFMQQLHIPGFSVAFAHRGKLAYISGYGVADAARKEPVNPTHLFRIASVSKPFTSVAIYTLVEQKKLTLDDTVFGHSGILSKFKLPSERAALLQQIQVRHLLTHTSGGWQNDGQDPMFRWPEMNQHELISETLTTHPLDFAPAPTMPIPTLAFASSAE
jgi:CubicO group peptidase (beta-lactamase class C family)